MEKPKVKHDHLFTKLLKATIFSLLMLAPLMAVGAKCAYTIFNKNAKDSWSQDKNEDIVLNYQTTSTLKQENTYYIVNGTYTIPTGLSVSSNRLYVNNVKSMTANTDFSNVRIIGFYNPGTLSLYMYDLNGNALYTDVRNYYLEFTYENIGTDNNNLVKWLINNNDLIFDITKTDYSYLDNAFYYAVDQLSEQPIFNWTTETAIYDAVNQMTTGFELGTSANIMALLISYWAILTAIYVIIDIVIELFVKLTHMFN